MYYIGAPVLENLAIEATEVHMYMHTYAPIYSIIHMLLYTLSYYVQWNLSIRTP